MFGNEQSGSSYWQNFVSSNRHGLVSGILEVHTNCPLPAEPPIPPDNSITCNSTVRTSVSRLCLRTPQLANAASAITSAAATSRLISTTSAATFYATPILCAEPLKKKKRIDPSVIKAREERRRKKLEKQIRRLEKNARQLKPIDEMEVPLVLIDERA